MVRIDHHEYLAEEEKRLKEDRERTKYWKKWGPYVAERQWATGIFPRAPFSACRADSFDSQFVRTTVQTAMPGLVSFSTPARVRCVLTPQIFLTNTHAREPSDGVKMALPVFQIRMAFRT